MTKKNASKRAARALKEEHGGSYQHHLRSVGGAGATPPNAPPEPGSVEQLTTYDEPTAIYMLVQLYEAAREVLTEHPDGHAFVGTVMAYTLPDRSRASVPMVPVTTITFTHDAPRWWFDGWLVFVDGELYDGDRPVGEGILATIAGRARLADILVQQMRAEAPWFASRLKSFDVKRGYAYENNLRVEVSLAFADEQVENFINLLQALEDEHAKVSSEMAKGATSLTWSTSAQHTAIEEARAVLAKLNAAAVTKGQKELAEKARGYERTWTRWEGSLTRVESMGAARE